MSFKAVVTFYVPGVVPAYDELLIKLGAEVAKVFCATEEELVSACSEANAVIALGIKITPGYVFNARVIENLNKCRLSALTGVGYDNGYSCRRGKRYLYCRQSLLLPGGGLRPHYGTYSGLCQEVLSTGS